MQGLFPFGLKHNCEENARFYLVFNMLKYNALAVLLVFLVAFMGCGRDAASFKVLRSVNLSIQSDTMKADADRYFSLRFQNVGNQILAYWIDYEIGIFHIIDVENSDTSTLKLNRELYEVVQQYAKQPLHNDYKFLTRTKLGFYFWHQQCYYTWDLANDSVVKYSLGDTLAQAGDSNLQPFSASLYPFSFMGPKVFFTCVYPNLHLSEQSKVKTFYNRHNLIYFNTTKDPLEYETFGRFPANYREGNMYNDLYFYKCINSKNEVVLSYPANDSLFIYTEQGIFKEQKVAKSEFREPFTPLSLEERRDVGALREYALTNNFYHKLIYDKYRNCYYRVFKKKTSFLTSDGKIRKPADLPWTLIILDGDFVKINEIEFDPSMYSPLFILPAKTGVYVGSPYEKWLDNHVVTLTLLNLEI